MTSVCVDEASNFKLIIFLLQDLDMKGAVEAAIEAGEEEAVDLVEEVRNKQTNKHIVLHDVAEQKNG